MARVERRLAAILIADVAGYSRLMGTDDVGTLSALRADLKQVVDPQIAAYGGRLVKNLGDGFLAEFASANDAVACAVVMQRAMLSRGRELPEDRRIQFRAGINIGDIIIENGDVFGDGVNIASRLEGLAEPGGI
jgi:adenylate cyclase